MKIGIIRCMQTEDMCATTSCLRAFENKKGAFADLDEEITLVGVNTCGGCPGKKAVSRAERMKSQGAQAIAFASCISRGNPIGFPCPHKEQMFAATQKKLGADVKILGYTHD